MKKQIEVIGKLPGYLTRRLLPNDVLTVDGPTARALIAIGKAKPAGISPKPPAEPAQSAIAVLRAQYTALTGKRPYMGWDAATLAEKISAAS